METRETNEQKHVVNHFEAGSNCQVFNGNITGCVFSTARRVDEMKARRIDDDQPSDEEERLIGSEEWALAISAGLIDEVNQPTVSRTEAALLANTIAERLGIKNKWKVFESLWQRKNMRGDYNTALDQRKSLIFQEKLKSIFC
jgi:hypothetical protein